MDFAEWKRLRTAQGDDSPIMPDEIWKAATAAEREACAKLIEDEDVASSDEPIGLMELMSTKIRARSNAKVSRGETTPEETDADSTSARPTC